jgi:hypothetical protein
LQSRGHPQTTTVATSFASALQAKVTDASGSPVANVTVTFAALSSGASATFGGSQFDNVDTNSAGIAISPVRWPTTPQALQRHATVPGVATPATFNLSIRGTATVDRRRLRHDRKVRRSAQYLAARFKRKSPTTFDNLVSGAPVTFAAPSSGASATFAGTNPVTLNTNAAGIVSPVPAANNTVGTYSVTATVAGVAHRRRSA